MFHLNRKLNIWVENALITKQQSEAILTFETENKSSKLTFAVISLGAFVVAMGIISLIASNWRFIPDTIKLEVDLGLFMAVIAAAYVNLIKGKQKTYEALLFFLFLFCGASIGLISQIFQTNGELYDAVLLWTLFTIPLLFATKIKLIPLFWVPLFFISLSTHFEFWRIFDFLFYHLPFLQNATTVMTGLLILGFGCLTCAFKALDKALKHKLEVVSVLYGYSFVMMYFAAATGIAWTFDENITDFLATLALILTFLGIMIYIAYRNNNTGRINFNIVMAGVAFFILYLQLVDDLITTGVGLITSGFIIIAMTVLIKHLWVKRAKK